MAATDPHMRIRIPEEIKNFLREQTRRYGGSMNSEIVRALREKMDRMQAATRAGFADTTHAAAFPETQPANSR